MKKITKLATFAAVTLLPAVAFAGKGGISANATLELLPVGSFAVEFGGAEVSADTDLAYGFGAQVDYWVTDAISVGIAPRYILNVIGKEAGDDADAASELDLAVRAQYNHMVNEKISAFGFLAPGYSLIMPPSSAGDDAESAAGLIIGFGAGGRYGINEKLFAQGELGYQLGFQATDGNKTATNYLHIGVGIGSHF